MIEKRVRQLVDALADHKDQVVDLAKWISFFTYVQISLNADSNLTATI